jgi:hypothetical protein
MCQIVYNMIEKIYKLIYLYKYMEYCFVRVHVSHVGFEIYNYLFIHTERITKVFIGPYQRPHNENTLSF